MNSGSRRRRRGAAVTGSMAARIFPWVPTGPCSWSRRPDARPSPGRRARHGEHRERSADPSSFSGVPTARSTRGSCARRPEVGREGEATLGDVSTDQLLEAGLVDRHLTASQRFDLRNDVVDADHVVAALREAGPGHEPDVAGPNYAELHGFSALQTARFRCQCKCSVARRAPARARRGLRGCDKSASLETRGSPHHHLAEEPDRDELARRRCRAGSPAARWAAAQADAEHDALEPQLGHEAEPASAQTSPTSPKSWIGRLEKPDKNLTSGGRAPRVSSARCRTSSGRPCGRGGGPATRSRARPASRRAPG